MTALECTDPASYFQFTPVEEQVRAVELAAAHKIVVITGGPGVGKTATTNAVLNMFEQNGIHTACCAPTGKAAIRMAEQTGREAATIHRLLHLYSAEPRGLDYPLEHDGVVLDEASMVDCELFAALLCALQTNTRLIIVGDVDQLPSIGPGRVLYDIIESGAVPVVRLTKIFRQATESRIPYVARDVNTGAPLAVENLGKDGDVIFAEVSDEQACLRAVVSACKTHLPNRGFKQDDIQVLCPQRSKEVGVENLNNVLQRELNPNAYPDNAANSKIGNGYTAYEGDRVIHSKNNYQLMVFNGEIGKLVKCNWKGLYDIGDAVYAGKFEGKEPQPPNKYVAIVDYGDRRVAYGKQEVFDLQLAYAITIHKAQGSQFKAVVMPIHSVHKFMLTRPLVYTGITRASELLLMVGESQILNESSTNTRGVQRRTTLKEALTC